MNEKKEDTMETTECEKAILEKLESDDLITSDDLSDVDPKTTKEYAMAAYLVAISTLRRLEIFGC